MRKFQFDNNKFYHIYNRGTEKRDIFINDRDFIRFIRSMREFNDVRPIGSLYEKDYLGVGHPIGCPTPAPQRLVEFISYCLCTNHYHFLLRQLVGGGISEFMKRLSGGYTNYFNHKHHRSGVLFQGKYKSVKVNNYSHFLILTVYVNCNSEIHRICSAGSWPWSSHLDYIGKRNGTLCNKDVISDEFANLVEFKNFCNQVLPDIIKIKELRGYFLE